MGHMRLKELDISNFKRLRHVVIRPEGALVQIVGLNDQGKSSVLQAISAALLGRGAAPPSPIRAGQQVSVIRLDLGELKVIREFEASDGAELTTRLKVTLSDGTKAAKPQATLDALIGALGFNPAAFLQMKPEDQYEQLKKFVVGFDFDAHDKAQKADYDERTIVNRRAKEARIQADKIELPEGARPEKVSVYDLIAKLDDANKHNADIDDRKARRDTAKSQIEGWLDEAESLRIKANDLERQAKELQAKLDAAPALPAPIDTAPIKAGIANAEQTGKIVEAFEARDRHSSEADEAEKSSASLTKRMADREETKTKAIAAAKMPIKGLDLKDGAVLLDGLPFSQAGMAKKLKASMSIAMALNPTLKIVLLDEGSEMDDDSLKIIEEMAKERGYLVMMTRVGRDGDAGIWIEDGQVAQK